MATKATVPEMALLRAVLAEELPGTWLRVPWAPGNEDVLNELRQEIHKALGTLSYRERGILELRFGLGDGWSYTLAEAGYIFKLTRERIRQLQVKSLRKLRKRAVGLREFVSRLGATGSSASHPQSSPPKKAR